MSQLRQQLSQARITKGALVIAILELVVSFGFIFLDDATKATVAKYVVASPSQIFEHGRVWTLVTAPFLELDFIQLIFSLLLLWMFVPSLERFWGTARFYRFVAVSLVVGNLAGCLVGFATGHDVPISGLSAFNMASIVAFGIVYARQEVMFSFYIKMTGRQLMYGFAAVMALVILFRQAWELGASWVAASLAAAIMTSKRWSPGLAWRRWRIARARARLSVIDGGAPKPKKRPDERFLN